MAKAENISLRELSDKLADELGVSKAASYEGLKEVFEHVAKTVHSGARVSIFGFGTFSLKERKARTGRNPQTGAAIKIAASKSIGFKPASSQKKTGKK
jgi:nucleoid DNA-binding protein